MPAVGRGAVGKPKSLVEHLNDQAPKRAVNDIVSITRYLMSARLLLNQATSYRVIGDEEQLYVILLRFASLVVETIPKHRDFRDAGGTYTNLKRELMERYLPELERLKTSLKLKERAEPPVSHSRNRPADAVQLSASDLPQLDWASSGAPVAAAAGPGSALAISGGAAGVAAPPPVLQVDDLLEVMRGGPGSAAATAVGGTPTRGIGGVGMGYGSPAGPTDPYALAAAAAAASLSSAAAMELPKYAHTYASASGSARHALFGSSPPAGGPGGAALKTVSQQLSLPRYPALDTSAAQAAAADLTALSLGQPSAGPSLGPQEVEVYQMSPDTSGLPDTCAIPHGRPPSPPPPEPAPPPPPSTAQPSPGGPKELKKAAQLRDVHVSVALMEEFLHYARSNTARGIESCGILAGKLLAGDSTFAINTLIIPKQQGTTDTVQALNEEEIFEAQFERELYPMGWIHTHPTQTCFLSSVDVHTQCGYQTMLDEAVAIVMAPSDRSKRCGIFRLSTPGGLSLVQKCPLRGFHTHPPTDTGQELYELCGHVFLNPRTKHEVLDLR
ncbi:hypothetical protein HYH02_005872 [Chlamydomonas schloesseri]|uniref:MPN domain-containing protein n=1 Tax=Chlamydomonas schloesseri TaxID=2026947 RepID=A0A836B702_9CHLO|nr:hypothetical protein HYH02_005872 [Chlamydomonas schloesseri]|eukprot:KAG2449124.1 hypothetical protein HYH02_005872 [Chlamydomonas schloesseri]